jgi:hypothetical protein
VSQLVFVAYVITILHCGSPVFYHGFYNPCFSLFNWSEPRRSLFLYESDFHFPQQLFRGCRTERFSGFFLRIDMVLFTVSQKKGTETFRNLWSLLHSSNCVTRSSMWKMMASGSDLDCHRPWHLTIVYLWLNRILNTYPFLESELWVRHVSAEVSLQFLANRCTYFAPGVRN